jgi:hypothetical protein
VEFEPTIPAFKQAKTFHAFDRVATVIGQENKFRLGNFCETFKYFAEIYVQKGKDGLFGKAYTSVFVVTNYRVYIINTSFLLGCHFNRGLPSVKTDILYTTTGVRIVSLYSDKLDGPGSISSSARFFSSPECPD